MSAAEPDHTSDYAEVLELCKEMVAADDDKKKQTQSKPGWLGVVGLADLSRVDANKSEPYLTNWIDENINKNENIGMLIELQQKLNAYIRDQQIMDKNNFADKIASAVTDRKNHLSQKGGRPKTSKKRSATRRRRSSKRQSRKMNKRRR